jgi:hypothetical protein
MVSRYRRKYFVNYSLLTKWDMYARELQHTQALDSYIDSTLDLLLSRCVIAGRSFHFSEHLLEKDNMITLVS